MRKRLWGKIIIFFVLAGVLSFPATVVWGQDYIPLVSPSVILMEQTTGKILYAKNENARMYPASMTKVLTALVVMDYLDPDDVVAVGPEIYNVPADYATALHPEGESITVRNLLRALIIRSGNDTGCILAINVVRAKENRSNIPYADAERLFNILMNEKARELGALNSNFNNSYGLHSESHYTTAYDLALISRAYMENDLLRQIAGERVYTGDSLEGRFIEGAKAVDHTWESHNELLLGGPNAYPYATGIKTGFTDEAGYCLAASAAKRDMELIAIIFYTPEPDRWQDARLLFDYGFDMFAFQTIHSRDEVLARADIANPRLGDDGFVDVLADEEATLLLHKEEAARLQRSIRYDDAFAAPEAETPGALAAPIEQDAWLGTVTYTLDGEVLYEGTVRAASVVLERNLDSDMDYYIQRFQDNVFTVKALPYWFGAGGLLVGILGIAVAITGRRRNRRDRWRDSRSYHKYRGYR